MVYQRRDPGLRTFLYCSKKVYRGRVFIFSALLSCGLVLHLVHSEIIFFNFISRVLAGFFTGCLLYEAYKLLSRAEKKGARRATILFCALTLAGFLFAGLTRGWKFCSPAWLCYSVFIFPSILLIALFSKRAQYLLNLRIFRFLGDISYTIYLIHFPLQLVVVTIDQANGYHLDYYSPAFFLSFFTLTVITAWFVFRMYEKPLQLKIRAWHLPGTP